MSKSKKTYETKLQRAERVALSGATVTRVVQSKKSYSRKTKHKGAF